MKGHSFAEIADQLLDEGLIVSKAALEKVWQKVAPTVVRRGHVRWTEPLRQRLIEIGLEETSTAAIRNRLNLEFGLTLSYIAVQVAWHKFASTEDKHNKRIWTKPMRERLLTLRGEDQLSFKDITDTLNREFGMNFSVDAVRKTWIRMPDPKSTLV